MLLGSLLRVLTWLSLPLWISASWSPALKPWGLRWPVLGTSSLLSEPRASDRDLIAALSLHSTLLKMGSRCLWDNFSFSQRKDPAVVSCPLGQRVQEKKLGKPLGTMALLTVWLLYGV